MGGGSPQTDLKNILVCFLQTAHHFAPYIYIYIWPFLREIILVFIKKNVVFS